MNKIFPILFLLFSFLGVQQARAQDSVSITPETWKFSGHFNLLVNQASFSKWASGGVNSVSLGLNINYDISYYENGWSWDTKCVGKYGLSYIEEDTFLKKINDRLEGNSLLGKEFSNTWSYSTILNFKSQFARGYSFGKNEEGEETRLLRTHLFSPAYLQFGVGLYWKKSSKLWVNIAPFTQRITFVSRKFTQDLGEGEAYFGVRKGDNHLFELGASVSGFHSFEPMENLVLENRLALYSDYLGIPENIDFDYTLIAKMKVNDYISTQLEVQLVYDDNAVKALQGREVLGVGVNFDL